MTRIELATADQKLINPAKVTIAAGDIASVELYVDFDSHWDSFPIRNATFHTSNNSTVYEVMLTDDTCIVPAEVLAEKGVLYIGARGVSENGEVVKTSSIVKYNIAPGATVGEKTLNPPMDLYQQYLAELNAGMDVVSRRIEQKLQENVDARISGLVATAMAFPDYKNKIMDVTYSQFPWTAPEDCWIVLERNIKLSIDGVQVVGDNYAHETERYNVFFPCEKGSVISVTLTDGQVADNEVNPDDIILGMYGMKK